MSSFKQINYKVVGIATLIFGLCSLYWLLLMLLSPAYKAVLYSGSYPIIYKTLGSHMLFFLAQQGVLSLSGIVGLLMIVGGVRFVNDKHSACFLWLKYIGLLPMIAYIYSAVHAYALIPVLTKMYLTGSAAQKMAVVVGHPFLGALDPRSLLTASCLGLWAFFVSLKLFTGGQSKILGILGMLWSLLTYVNLTLHSLPAMVGMVVWVVAIIWYLWFAFMLFRADSGAS